MCSFSGLTDAPFQVVNLLLDSGARFLPTQRNRVTALQLAARNGHLDCVKMLLHHYPQDEHLNWADGRGWTALTEACSNGYLPIVNFLIEKGAKADHTDESKRTALHIAALRGHVEVCGALLAVKPELLDATDYFSATAMLLALDQQRIPVLEFLMMRKPDLAKGDKEGYTVAHVAALTGTVSVLRAVAIADRDQLEAVDYRGRTPLLLAAQRGQLESIKFLASEGVSLDHTDIDGMSALAYAAAGNNAPSVRYLMEKQPNLLTKTDLHCRPAADLALKDEAKEVFKTRPFPTQGYITECIDKLHGLFREIKVTGAFQGAEFDTNDGALELIRKTLAQSGNVAHHQAVAKFLGGSLAKPMAEFRNVLPIDGKVAALRAKIAAAEGEEGLEAACDNLRDRGRLVVYLTDRWTRNVRVTRNMPIKADKEVISVITEMVDGYKAQIAKWEHERNSLANERADLQIALSKATAAIAPLKSRFSMSFDAEHPLDSLNRYEKRISEQTERFHKSFDVSTKRLSDDIEMLLAVQHVISVQIAQQGRIFTAKLNRMKQEVDRAKDDYLAKLASIQPALKEALDNAHAKYEEIQKQFGQIAGDGGMVEVRKGFLADISKIELELATLERLSKRIAAVANEIEGAAGQEVDTLAEVKLMSSTVYFERQLPKPAAAYASHRPYEVNVAIGSEKEGTTPTDLFRGLESLMVALPAADPATADPADDVARLAVAQAIAEEQAAAEIKPEVVLAEPPSSAPKALKPQPSQKSVTSMVELPPQNVEAPKPMVPLTAQASQASLASQRSVAAASTQQLSNAEPVAAVEAQNAAPKEGAPVDLSQNVDPKKLPSRSSSKANLVSETADPEAEVPVAAVTEPEVAITTESKSDEAKLGEAKSMDLKNDESAAAGVQSEPMPSVAALKAKFDASPKKVNAAKKDKQPVPVPSVQPNIRGD